MAATAKTKVGGDGYLANIFTAILAPTVDNDAAANANVGDIWINTVAHTVYVCEDTTAGAAVWTQIAGTTLSASVHVGADTPTVDSDTLNGFAVSNIWVNTATDLVYVCVDATTGAAIWRLASGIHTSASAPAVTNDAAHSCAIGDVWVNTTTKRAYICIDASAGAAVWKTINSELSNAIADPGAAGAIPVTQSGYVEIVTGAAEARSLADPAFVGQQLLISMKTYVGACTITVANAFDAAGSTSIVLGAAGQSVLLVAHPNGANIRWQLAANDGATAGRMNLEYVIADPGNGQAIPVTKNGHVDIVTGGAETRTLAAPSFAGQQLLISFKTRVGNCVITCATTVNQTGNNTITLDTAGDAVTLVAKTNGADLRWSVVHNDGASITTV